MSIRRPPPTRRVRDAHQSRSATVRAAAAAPSRRQLSRWDRDRRQTLLLGLAFGALAVLVAVILAIGWYVDNVLQGNDVAARVVGQPITTAQVADEMRTSVQAIDAQIRRAPAGANTRALASQAEQQKRGLPDQALNALVEQRILEQEAGRRGITVTPDEVEERIRRDIAEVEAFSTPQATPSAVAEPSPTAPAASPAAGASPTTVPSPTPVPTLEPTPQEAALTRQLEQVGLGRERYRELVRRDVLREKVQKAIGEQVPATQEQVRARHILLPDEESARQALARLEQGADFAQLAAEVSTDPGTKDKGGDLGWFARGQMNPPFETAAFALQPGQRSGVVQSPSGYHIIEVLERDANRPVPESELESLRAQAFSTWLSEQRSGPEVQLEFSSGERDWTLRHVGVRP